MADPPFRPVLDILRYVSGGLSYVSGGTLPLGARGCPAGAVPHPRLTAGCRRS
jgi:hypothetical protein